MTKSCFDTFKAGIGSNANLLLNGINIIKAKELVEKAIAKGSIKTFIEFCNFNINEYRGLESFVNEYIELIENHPPYEKGATVTKVTLKVGTIINMVCDHMNLSKDGLGIRKFGRFATFDEVPNLDYKINNLAIKQEWKDNKTSFVLQLKVINTLEVESSLIGQQLDLEADKLLVGGGTQVMFLDSETKVKESLKILNKKTL